MAGVVQGCPTVGVHVIHIGFTLDDGMESLGFLRVLRVYSLMDWCFSKDA